MKNDKIDVIEDDFDGLLKAGFVYLNDEGQVFWDEDIRLGKFYIMQEAIDAEILYYVNGELLIKNDSTPRSI